jgi:acyl carrier protein
MPVASKDNIHARVSALVEAILEQHELAVSIAPDSRLADAGLTSMDMVNLMLLVEAEFDLTIPQAEITPENFESVSAIERMVERQILHAAA